MRGTCTHGAIAALLLSAPIAQAQLCDTTSAAYAAGGDLHCFALLPVPGVDRASGAVELARVPSPFTVAVTPQGGPVVTPVITLAGLPDPSTLGPYTTYVAWVAPPIMYPITSLGPVSVGRTQVRPITADPFVILITAESSPDVTEPSRRVVLRGASPSTRLQPPDVLEFTAGAAPLVPDSMPGAMTSGLGHTRMTMSGEPSGEADSARWTGIPMPVGLTMLPAEMALRPSVAAYLPQGETGEPAVGPRQLVRLAGGDTLHLAAGLVRRTIAGQRLTMYAFNGQYPGPLISVPQGADVVVDFANHLDQPTTVHWHGVRLDNPFDGVPDVTQPAVPPGGQFTYHLRFPDAGVYWYHPHVREDIQQNLGLTGNILVRSPRRDYFSPAHREEVLMLSDVLLGDHGLVPYGRTAPTHALMGRFGNVLLVNGARRYELSATRGEVVRFYLTNAANTRTFNVSIPGARMKLVGSDVGNFEHEEWVTSVVIAPAERYVVHVRFDRAGRYALLNQVRGLDHLNNRFFTETDTLGVVHVSSEAAAPDLAASFPVLRADTAVAADIDRYRTYFDRPPDKTLVLTLETQHLPFVTRELMQIDSIYFVPIEWTGTMPGMNWASTPDQVRWVLRDAATGKENMDIGWEFTRGDVIKLRVVNDRRSLHAMQHPIHLHGQRFLVLAVDGVRNTNLVWKDTVLVPAGSTVDLIVDLANPGRWMLHCHIAEHLATGMMTAFIVR
jgi:suppressor of ftsI